MEPLNPKQIGEAVSQVRSYLQNQNELNPRDWQLESVRGILYKLGYHGTDADQVVHAMFEAGFTYCIDPHYPTKDGTRVTEDACHWAPDQLLSRIPSNWAIESTFES
jgi:hypothetical protein